MRKKIIFTALFLTSILVFNIASLSGWLIATLIFHIIWLTVTSNEIIRIHEAKHPSYKTMKRFNKFLLYLLLSDFIIAVLSMSFAFRLIFAYLYTPIYYFTIVCSIAAILGNYYIVFTNIINKPIPIIRKLLLGASSLFYPIGVYIFTLSNYKD